MCHRPTLEHVPTPRTFLTFRPEEERGAASGAWNSPYFSYLEIFYLHPPTYPPSLARTSLLFIFIHFRCILVHFISSYHEAAFNEMFLEDS